MTHTIAAIKARQNLGDLLNKVSLKHDEFIVERGGRPMAAIIPIEKFEHLKQAARSILVYALKKNQDANRSANSLSNDGLLLQEAKHRSRNRKNRKV